MQKQNIALSTSLCYNNFNTFKKAGTINYDNARQTTCKTGHHGCSMEAVHRTGL